LPNWAFIVDTNKVRSLHRKRDNDKHPSKRETKMTTANATKKLVKAGFQVTAVGRRISAKKGFRVIELTAGSEETIQTVRVRAACDSDDIVHDYTAGVYCDNVTQAIKLAGN
jgi:hypothetical protein